MEKGIEGLKVRDGTDCRIKGHVVEARCAGSDKGYETDGEREKTPKEP
jgi:hypothetical protein